MEKGNSKFVFGSIWEIIRFILLYTLVLIGFNPSFNIETSILLIWLSSAQLIIAVGLFMLWYDFSRYNALIPLLLLGKGLNLFSPLLLSIGGIGFAGKLLRHVNGAFGNGIFFSPLFRTNFGFILLSAGLIVFFDLIFFFILLSYRAGSGRFEKKDKDHLPDWGELKVEEE